MGQREAEQSASRAPEQISAAKAPAARPIWSRRRRSKHRWLVDFETQAGLYTVAVDNGGNTEVSVWDKNPAR